MPTCKFCNQDGLEWYQDSQEKWKLGVKLDINNYRPHKCMVQLPVNGTTTSNKRNWIYFTCTKCGNKTRQNVKTYKSKTINLCYDCDNIC